MVTPELDHRTQIANAAAPDEIIEALAAFGLDKVVERLRYLRSLDDDLANDEQPMDLESLRALATLLIERPELPKPGIGVSEDGMLQLEWNIVPTGLLAMMFRPPDQVDFAAVMGPLDSETDRPSASGSGTQDEALAALEPFMNHLAPR